MPIPSGGRRRELPAPFRVKGKIMENKKTDAEIDQLIIEGVEDLIRRDIEELILAGRYKEAMIVAREVLEASESELKKIEEIIADHRLEASQGTER